MPRNCWRGSSPIITTKTFYVVVLAVVVVVRFFAECQRTEPPASAAPLIRVGMLFPQQRVYNRPIFSDSAGAALLAIDRADREGLLPRGTNFSFFWRYEECLEHTSAGYTFEMITKNKIDVLIGPPCRIGSRSAGLVCGFHNIPITIWGTQFVSKLTDASIYPTLISIMPNFKNLAMAAIGVMKFFSWTTLGLISQNEGGSCRELQGKLDEVINEHSNMTINYRYDIFNWNETRIRQSIRQIERRARVVIMCFDNAERLRDLSLMLYDAGFHSTEYVYFIINIDIALTKESQQSQLPFWKRRGEHGSASNTTTADEWAAADRQARSIAQRSFFFTLDKTRDMANTARTRVDFAQRAIARMADYPFFCAECANNSTGKKELSPYAFYLYDAFYAYLWMLSRTIDRMNSASPRYYRNGTLLSENADGEFKGMTGTISLDNDGIRSAIFSMTAYDEDDRLVQYLSIQVLRSLTNISTLFDDAARTIWASRNGQQPRAIPYCGFDGNLCAARARAAYHFYLIVGSALLAVALVIGGVALAVYAVYMKRRDTIRENARWQIHYPNLTKYVKEGSQIGGLSRPSLRSGPTSSLTALDGGGASNGGSTTADSGRPRKFTSYLYEGARVTAMSYDLSRHQLEFDAAETGELRMMRQLDHENLNRFVGLCLDGPRTLSLWRYCMRGSIRDVLDNNALAKDAVFVVSIIRDLVEGLCFIHQSALECHGNLKSTYCLIDERWKVKISYYGLRLLRRREDVGQQDVDELLWRAPELLRLIGHKGRGGAANGSSYENGRARKLRSRQSGGGGGGGGGHRRPAASNGHTKSKPNSVKPVDDGGNGIIDLSRFGTKKGDIYSFAIIASELVNMSRAWERTTGGAGSQAANNLSTVATLGQISTASVATVGLRSPVVQRSSPAARRNADEIVYMVKKGGLLPPRPALHPAVDDLDPALMHLIRDCWAERPEDRPKIDSVRATLRGLQTSGKGTLMDHVFNKLENYANTLEEVVKERTEELVLEQKKSDLLLYRMLPKQIADRLKVGQAVEPESYDYVTIFFSDVVSFTTLSGRMKPLEVVNFLNELYTHFDSVIGEFDVYKVETIGDGYLCASGLPHRNGNAHFRHIANMSLKLIRTIESFKIESLPDEQVRIRIGIHSGPCVTGVVGLAMPRYCLFGDTVNTASRMESSSMPNRIHISNITNHFLTQTLGGYVTERRGEIIIKGKGVMETYWLLGTSADEATKQTGDGNQQPQLTVADVIAGTGAAAATAPTVSQTTAAAGRPKASRTSLREKDRRSIVDSPRKPSENEIEPVTVAEKEKESKEEKAKETPDSSNSNGDILPARSHISVTSTLIN